MQHSFINVHTKSKVALETEKYLIHRRIKSKLSYSDNYLEIKEIPKNEDELAYYIDACREFFRDKSVNFINLALPENTELDKKLVKFLKNNGYTNTEFDLYRLDVEKIKIIDADNLNISVLEKADYPEYIDFNYKIDLEFANEEWANHNKESIYEDIRNEEIVQLIAKENNKIIASVNIILNDNYLEVDNLYVAEKYRKKGIASGLIHRAIKIFNKKYIILIADSYDTPKYMYEKMGFEHISSKIYFLKSEL
ncbi:MULTISPECIES: GNAT family N-acetyltransferase [unclassified Gemella]|uniref:GNAT family N-acetyltransferase n=1 Tax=unclassified Gemella TaxID=2624949 RepID=UPI001C05041B|nr:MULTISPECIES: GNAT family N-acetyltransferase [unclassified Gemella]MBU0279016.1 GNAT family N-acetyltransferase [Gemella sp. zg-1178]QWQ39088.1 GNAT family N-acetyltransferase [Gemella sp. zg-570]